MLVVRHPKEFALEYDYILRILFEDFLGIPLRLEPASDPFVRVIHDGQRGELRLIPAFFSEESLGLVSKARMPKFPVKAIEGMPVLFGTLLSNGRYVQKEAEVITIGVDIVGSAFFLLTRYEEALPFTPDQHGRFPAKQSTLSKIGCLRRPLVNEYLEWLWKSLSTLWPALKRKPRQYSPFVSHDVDSPLSVVGRSTSQLLKSAASDLLLRKDLELCFRRLVAIGKCRNGDWDADVSNTFDFIMDTSEKHSLKSSFYFFGGKTSEIDGDYEIETPWFRKLFKKIHHRGHEIGLHPSYETFRDQVLLKQELDNLQRVCAEEGVTQFRWGGRQHFLRWDVSSTWYAWEKAGLDYDSSVGFAEDAGFRCGVCYPFNPYDLHKRRKLLLIERPLIAMEGALLVVQKRSLRETIDVFDELAQTCRRYKGEFALLWHNSQLLSKQQKSAYMKLLQAIT